MKKKDPVYYYIVRKDNGSMQDGPFVTRKQANYSLKRRVNKAELVVNHVPQNEKYSIDTCECCQADEVLVRKYIRDKGKSDLLCDLCAGSYASMICQHENYPHGTDKIVQVICYVGNEIIKHIDKILSENR